MRSENEKRELVEYWKKHGRQATMKKFKCSDVSIYKYNRELGLYPNGRAGEKQEAKIVLPEMVEIKASEPGTFVLNVPKLVIRTKNVEVISDS